MSKIRTPLSEPRMLEAGLAGIADAAARDATAGRVR
jgi:hypothetical protein